MSSFELVTAPRIVFGAGRLEELGAICAGLGRRALLVLGGGSAERSGLAGRVRGLVPVAALARCPREPGLEEVEQAVRAGREAGCDLVVAAGGGSVLDCAKAAAGLLGNPGPLIEYLEGVGSGRSLEGPALPTVAVPTTAGTGSEVTRNAVISGPGFKKSMRSTLLVPRVALVDPELIAGAPAQVVASCGMDALTQLIEPYLSRGASPVTDGLALQGIAAAGASLESLVLGPGGAEAREGMALASLLGGICLTNAGLGAVHGLASPLGALFPIAHGIACGALLPQVMRENLEAAVGTPMQERVRTRFAAVAEALCGVRFEEPAAAIEAGLAELSRLQRALAIPRLAELGVGEADFPRLLADARGSSMRYNPVDLEEAQLQRILRAAL